MSAWLIAFVGVIYLFIGIREAMRGNVAMAIVFCGYASSNVGLYWLALQGAK